MADNPQEKLREQHDRHIAADADTHVGPKSSKDQLEIERLRLEIE